MQAHGFTFTFEPELSTGDFVALIVTLPDGRHVRLWSQVDLADGAATLLQFSIYGANDQPLQMGVALLRRMAEAAMEVFDVGRIRIVEARRTTGAGPGRTAAAITFRRRGP